MRADEAPNAARGLVLPMSSSVHHFIWSSDAELPRRARIVSAAHCRTPLARMASAFALPGQWVDVSVAGLDVSLPTGEFRFAYNLMGLRYAQVEVAYTAGLAVIPDAVKVACAQIVKNAQATPGMNVKASKMDTLQMEYFSGSLIDPQVQLLLKPYVAERLG